MMTADEADATLISLASIFNEQTPWLLEEVKTYIENNERVIAFTIICDSPSELETPISQSIFQNIEELAHYLINQGVKPSEVRYDFLKKLIDTNHDSSELS